MIIHERLKLLGALIVFAEDGLFFEHYGLRWRTIYKVFLYNLHHSKKIGGSTITQQLARTLYLSAEKSYWRKIKEAVLALWLEQKYTKEELLALYINKVNYGKGCIGIKQAACFYYHKTLQELELLEIVTLVAILPNPERNNPADFPEDALRARKKLLYRLYKGGWLTGWEAYQLLLQSENAAVAAAEFTQRLIAGFTKAEASRTGMIPKIKVDMDF